MWGAFLDGVRGGVDRVSHSLNEYGPPIEWSPASWLSSFMQQSTAALGLQRAQPPPPPPPPSAAERLGTWLLRHRAVAAYTLGGAIAVGLGIAYYRTRPPLPHQGATVDGRRTQAVVVLGGDTPLGRALALSLASRDLIVLASVQSESAKRALEFEVPPPSRGYVKALVLTPGAEDAFARAVHAALCMRFPLTTGGDPYARPGENVEVLGVVNALSFAPDAHSAALAQRSPSELERALTTHVVTPLTALERLVPLITAPPNRTRALDAAVVVSLVSLPATRAAQPGHGAASIVAQAVRAGLATLRREAELDHGPGSARSAEGRAPRTLRWTTVEVDAAHSAAFLPQPATQQLVRAGQRVSAHVPRDVLDRVASLLFAAARPLWPTYTVAGRTAAGRWLSALASALVQLVPSSVLDVVLVAHARFRAHTAPRRTLHEHLQRLVRDATAPPPALRPGSQAHTRGVPSRST